MSIDVTLAYSQNTTYYFMVQAGNIKGFGAPTPILM